MAEIGLAASIIAVIQITTAVTTQAYKYGQDIAKAKDEIGRVSQELDDLNDALKQLENLAIRAEKSGRPLDSWPVLISLQKQDGPLKDCKAILFDLKAQMITVNGRSARILEGVKWASSKKNKVEKALLVLRQHKITLLESLNVAQAGQVFDSGSKISRMSKAQNETNRHEIIKWLLPVDCATDQASARKKHEDKTGEWFTKGEKCAKWKEAPNSFMWLHGIPGSGKTILSSEIINDTQAYCERRPGSLVAYFFFSFREEKKQKAINFLSSILAQLVLQISTLPDSLQTFHQNNQHGQPPEAGLFTAIKSLLTAPTFIIVDALDECPENGNQRKDLCKMLAELHSWNLTDLHVLVTSREEQDLSAALGSLVTSNPISITEEVESDIHKYVNTQLIDDDDLKNYSMELKAKIEKTLVAKAKGMFRWVDCQLEELKRCPDPEESLESLPATLDETYARILRGIDATWQSKAIAALQWIAFSEEPLTKRELFDAMVVDPKFTPPFSPQRRLVQPQRILRVLSSLVTVTIDDQTLDFQGDPLETISLAHFSVQEYLESTRILDVCGAASFHLNKKSAYQLLMKSCLLYIKYDTASKNSLDLEARRLSLPLLKHACRNWRGYAKASGDGTPSRLDRLVFEFLSSDKDRESWIEACGGLKGVGSLYYASDMGMSHVVDMILDTRVEIDASVDGNGTALQAASRGGYNEVVQQLIKAGATVNLVTEKLGTALQEACSYSKTDTARLLLSAGADVNIQGGHYATPLHAASYRPNTDIIRLLLSAGADVNIQGGYYGTALQAASCQSNPEIVRLLLSAGADVNIQGGYYGTALQAASYRSNPDIVRLLLSAGADINIQGGYYGTALLAASRRFKTDNIRLLLKAGADVNIQGGIYGSALLAASTRPDSDIVRLLLDAGADVRAIPHHTEQDYGTALHAAAYNGRLDIVQVLLDAGADVNVVAGPYGTVLQAASAGDWSTPAMILKLLDAGHEVNTAQKVGRYGSALGAALEHKNDEVARILLDRGADVAALNTKQRGKLDKLVGRRDVSAI